MSVKIQFVKGLLADAEYDDGYHLRKDLPPGSADWSLPAADGTQHLFFTCPCGCGRVRAVPAKLTGNPAKAWAWNGDEALPTFSPSIWFRDDQHPAGGCAWHGWLTDGVFNRC